LSSFFIADLPGSMVAAAKRAAPRAAAMQHTQGP
jgi:hypothetical protein